MGKTFREWRIDKPWLLPPSVRELVPEGDAAHFVRELVREELDLSAILDTYEEERGFPPYHPVMMTALLLYALTQGVRSSRKIARACETRVDFMAVTAMQRPDFRTKTVIDTPLIIVEPLLSRPSLPFVVSAYVVGLLS